MSRKIEIDGSITVGELASQLELPATTLVAELFKNGIMATLNEKIDLDTANIIVTELGLDVQLAEQVDKAPLQPSVRQEREGQMLKTRPPVVAVMGHVDHGKTSLLDHIRQAHVAEKEAGGITQHINAYQVEHNDRYITFLDTPGHEAFAAIREHGAALTDIAVIVIAADDGIKPQTLEAIRFAQKAGVKMIVAANKIDKQGANLDRLKQQLAEQQLLPEDWGGDTTVVSVSAKTGEGVTKLLEMILLVADVEDLKADARGSAEGLIIEARMETGMGPTVSALVQDGVLSRGDFIVAGSAYGKVRILKNSAGDNIPQAEASTPVTISGLKTLPNFGDIFQVVPSEKEAKRIANINDQRGGAKTTDLTSGELLRIISRRTSVEELRVFVKADVQGSLTAVTDAIKSIDTDEIITRIVGTGVGPIGEGDVRSAAASSAILYGFNLTVSSSVRRIASQLGVEVKVFSVIYELLDDVRLHLESLLTPEVVETELGRLIIRGVFNTTKNSVICGGELTKGSITLPARAKIIRDQEQLAEVEIVGLKKGPSEVAEVREGDMCGLSLRTDAKLLLEEGDKLEIYRQELKERKLTQN